MPLALTPKSVCGSLAAQSWEGWAAVWMTSSILPACSTKDRSIASPSRMSAFSQRNSECSATSRSVTCEVEDFGPEEAGPHVVLDADDVEPLGDEVLDRLGADQAPRTRDDRNRHSCLLPSRRGGVDVRVPRRSAPRPPRSTRGCRPAPARRCAAGATRRGRRAWRSRRGRSGTSPARVSATGAIGTSLPVSAAADLGRLQQREAALAAAADVDGAPVPRLRVEQLALDQVDQVLDVEQVAHLLAAAAEADVGERVAEVVGEHPVGEDPLVDLAHLPGPGDHAAAVDHRRHAEPRPVLLDQQLGGELGRPVEGAGAVQRELLGDARRRDARRPPARRRSRSGSAPPRG